MLIELSTIHGLLCQWISFTYDAIWLHKMPDVQVTICSRWISRESRMSGTEDIHMYDNNFIANLRSRISSTNLITRLRTREGTSNTSTIGRK